jgi:hypothetical protein
MHVSGDTVWDRGGATVVAHSGRAVGVEEQEETTRVGNWKWKLML